MTRLCFIIAGPDRPKLAVSLAAWPLLILIGDRSRPCSRRSRPWPVQNLLIAFIIGRAKRENNLHSNYELL